MLLLLLLLAGGNKVGGAGNPSLLFEVRAVEQKAFNKILFFKQAVVRAAIRAHRVASHNLSDLLPVLGAANTPVIE